MDWMSFGVALMMFSGVSGEKPEPPAPKVKISCEQKEVGMGRTVRVAATVMPAKGQSKKGCLLLPYVNGLRWGSHEFSDEQGRAEFLLPMPNPGCQEILVASWAALESPKEEWIWAPTIEDQKTISIQHVFSLDAEPDDSALWVAVDDQARVWLNQERMVELGGWTKPACVPIRPGLLRQGENILSVEAFNYNGPAGLLVRLEMTSEKQETILGSSPEWRSFSQIPGGWPGKAADGGQKCVSVGTVDSSTWCQSMGAWPTRHSKDLLITGTPLHEGAHVSNALKMRVNRRMLETIPTDPKHLVGMQWEPWFTPLNAFWQTAQAVPVMGFFKSYDPNVTRQHMLWMMESGVDFLVVDWTNHLWDRKHWTERPEGTNEIIHATTLALECLATLRDEGFSVPKVVLYPGLNNGPETTMTAINEELAWIHDTYVRNPRFKGLFLETLGKPLILVHNGGGPDWIKNKGYEPIREDLFAVRWQSSQEQLCRHNEVGYWSWMDGSLDPKVTVRDGKPEAMTVSVAFFSPSGWLDEDAYGRRGGWTYVESFKHALRVRPRFMEIHQFNEFAGQVEGQGYGPDKQVYCDSYSVELSDDIEPVSLNAAAYRGNGGWGYFYLNLTRALVDLYRQEIPETTVVVASSPTFREAVQGDQMEVVWTWAGKEPTGVTIEIDGQKVAQDLQGTRASVDLRPFRDGERVLRLIAQDTVARYPILYKEEALPAKVMDLACVEVPFSVQR